MHMDFRVALIALAITLPVSALAQTPPTQGKMSDRFAAANTTHDGCLTADQANAGGLKSIAKNFAQIDTTKHGCVTLDEIKAFNKAKKASAQQPPAAPQ